MKKTYEMYFRAGNEPFKFIGVQVAEDVRDIIKQATKTVEHLINYKGVEKQLLVKCESKQVVNFTF